VSRLRRKLLDDRHYDELVAVAGPVSRETFEKIRLFKSTFESWSARINLVSSNELNSLWRRHVLDSAQLVRLADDFTIWLDLGSGGGFPGIIVAILNAESPGKFFHLVESTGKKAAFLRTALTQVKAHAQVHQDRIENLASRIGAVDIVSARALAPLPTLLCLAEPWLSAGARGLFHKGRDYRAEIGQSRDDFDFDLLEHPNVVDATGVVLEIFNLRRLG
jgi:16S rRNA (guanine527-N7)-methyltransferase